MRDSAIFDFLYYSGCLGSFHRHHRAHVLREELLVSHIVKLLVIGASIHVEFYHRRYLRHFADLVERRGGRGLHQTTLLTHVCAIIVDELFVL